MTAVILAWNPEKWNWDGAYRTAVASVRDSGRHLRPWPLEGDGDLPAGAEAWLLVQGDRPNQRGLIGHGVTVSDPYTEKHPDSDDGDGPVTYVSVEFDLLLPEGEQLRTETLAALIPTVPWETAPGSGSRIPPEVESTVRDAWGRHLRDSTWGERGELEVVPGVCPDESLARIYVNRYERRAEDRRQAIALHGPNCQACGFDFEATYGPEGAGVVHVHHTVPVSRLEWNYELDPRADLVPLCPNCHYMAHRRSDPYTVAELRRMISTAGHLTGAVVTDAQLAAQEAARRITSSRPE